MAERAQVTGAADSSEGSGKTSSSGSRRFVILFIVYTLFPLLGYQFFQSTSLMDAYLFQVARQTAWVLGWIGESCQVEHSGAFTERQATLRSASKSRQTIAEGKPAAAPNQRPLSAWQAWRHRIVQMRQRIARFQADADQLEMAPQYSTTAGPVYAKQIAEQVVRLERSARSDDALLGAALMRPEPGLTQSLEAVKSGLAALAAHPPDDLVRAKSVLNKLAAQVDAIRSARLTYLRRALEKAKVQLRIERAPLVIFTYDAGLAGRLNAAQQRLIKLKSGPTPQKQAKAIALLQARIVAMTKKLRGGEPRNRAVEFRFRIAPECSAIPSMIIYLAAVFAFPTRWRTRFVGLLGGLPILHVVNILRLTCLGVIGAFNRGGPWFKFSHQYIWQGIYIIFVVGVWMAWVEYLVRRRGS